MYTKRYDYEPYCDHVWVYQALCRPSDEEGVCEVRECWSWKEYLEKPDVVGEPSTTLLSAITLLAGIVVFIFFRKLVSRAESYINSK